jgi:hypothetical protein
MHDDRPTGAHLEASTSSPVFTMNEVSSARHETQERETALFDLQRAGQDEMIWGDGPPRCSNTLAARLLLA